MVDLGTDVSEFEDGKKAEEREGGREERSSRLVILGKFLRITPIRDDIANVFATCEVIELSRIWSAQQHNLDRNLHRSIACKLTY